MFIVDSVVEFRNKYYHFINLEKAFYLDFTLIQIVSIKKVTILLNEVKERFYCKQIFLCIIVLPFFSPSYFMRKENMRKHYNTAYKGYNIPFYIFLLLFLVLHILEDDLQG